MRYLRRQRKVGDELGKLAATESDATLTSAHTSKISHSLLMRLGEARARPNFCPTPAKVFEKKCVEVRKLLRHKRFC
jgi:hypothetical protein